MAIFEITGWSPADQKHRTLRYDSDNSRLMYENGTNVLSDVRYNHREHKDSSVAIGKRKLKTIKIQLGLSCNYECEYCNQRFVPHADSTNPDDVQPFVDNMSNWFDGGEDGLGEGAHFEFWGGEPLVYWKTLKPLAEAIGKKYPNAGKSVITNGSLLDKEKNDWFIENKFTVSVSHDGPGQSVRGPDPLEDPKSKDGIIDLFKRLAPENKFSFNSMINSKNKSRAGIQKFFLDFVQREIGEEYTKYVVIGEGTFIDAYDEGGYGSSLLDGEEDVVYRNNSLAELREGKVTRFAIVPQKVEGFIKTLTHGVPLSSVQQKCGMDREDNIAIDLNGNVLTCQNVSAVSVNPAGVSHKIGNVSDLEAVRLNTATHWKEREECPNCPVIHICKGACFFLTGPLWEASCDNAFSDNIVMFCIAIEELTGIIPEYIEGPLREDRKDIFWWNKGKPANVRKPKKVIPIVAA